MHKNIYVPIINTPTKETFNDYIDSLDIPQIDYFAIGLQNTLSKQSISLMSLPEWQDYFSANNLASYDPVRKATLLTKRNIIPFDEIDFVDNFGKEIMRQRSLMGIQNGIVFMERFPKYNYMITLGTSFSKFDSFDFIKKYHDKISLMKSDLIQIIEKDATNFLPKQSVKPNYPSIDAK